MPGPLLLIRSKPAMRERSSALTALASLGLGVVVGLQWVTWAYVDLRASAHEGYEAALATVITPFGAGFALLGRALAKSGSAPAALATAGVVIGGATVVTASGCSTWRRC